MTEEPVERPHRKADISAGLFAALQLTRPRNCLLTALSVWVGAVTSGQVHATAAVGFAALGAAAIAAAGNGMNDVIDLPVDRRNRPERPIPSGRLSAPAALAISAFLGAAGLTLAFVAGILPGLIAFGVLMGLAVYNWFLKRTGLPGNLLVSLIAAATFPYGAATAGNWGNWWIPAIFAALYHGGREIVKGVEDMEGDRVAGVRTLALSRGAQFACRSATFLLGLVGLLALWPAILDIYGPGYLLPVVVLELFLVFRLPRLWRGLSPTDRRFSPELLIGMALGLLAIVLGELLDPRWTI